MPAASRALTLSHEAQSFWAQHYNALILTGPTASEVMALTRRHRLHALILSSLLAILDLRAEIREQDIACALLWCEYSRRSVVYAFNSVKEQHAALNYQMLAKGILRLSAPLQKRAKSALRLTCTNGSMEK